VLLVEDMDFFEEVARQALEATAELVAVKTVADARRALAQGGFDLLLLDLALEGEDGRDLLRNLPYKPCPILIFGARRIRHVQRRLGGLQSWEPTASNGQGHADGRDLARGRGAAAPAAKRQVHQEDRCDQHDDAKPAKSSSSSSDTRSASG
jgi:CheY-like chemotaxis protein